MDSTGIERMIELDQPPHVVNVLVFCDHFTRLIMIYVTPDWTAKTVAKFCGKDTSQSLKHQPSS